MNAVELFALIVFIVQIVHSIEELITGFHKKWYFCSMPFWVFFLFEITFTLFWGAVLFLHQFPFRLYLLAIFLILMFVNGIQHVVWFGFAKKYIPGLITAFIHIIVFLFFYFTILTV